MNNLQFRLIAYLIRSLHLQPNIIRSLLHSYPFVFRCDIIKLVCIETMKRLPRAHNCSIKSDSQQWEFIGRSADWIVELYVGGNPLMGGDGVQSVGAQFSVVRLGRRGFSLDDSCDITSLLDILTTSRLPNFGLPA